MPVAMTASRKFGISRDSLRQKHGPAFWAMGERGRGAVQAANERSAAYRTNQIWSCLFPLRGSHSYNIEVFHSKRGTKVFTARRALTAFSIELLDGHNTRILSTRVSWPALKPQACRSMWG